jgi:hypothetical protein
MQSSRSFLDFVVDGVSLYDRHGADDISCLGWFTLDEDEQAARRLLSTAEPDVEDRVALWVCAECGDVLCGALTARIARNADEFIWRDFALSWRDHAAGRWVHETGPFADWDEIRFDAAQYQQAISGRPPAAAPADRSSHSALRRVLKRLRPRE